jgi:hypothetical protein
MNFYRCVLMLALLSLFALAGFASAQTATTPRVSATVTLTNGESKFRIEAKLTGDDLTISNIPNSTFLLTSYTLKQLRNANPDFPAMGTERDDARFFVILFPTPNEERNRQHRAEGKGMAMKGRGMNQYIKVNDDELYCGILKITTNPGLLSTGVATFKVTGDRADVLLGNLLPGDEIVGFAFRVALPVQ